MFQPNFNNRKKRRHVKTINAAPFIDLLLVLLLVFMIASPSNTGNIDVDLPESSAPSKKEESQSDPIIITASKNNIIYLMDEPIEANEIIAKLLIITKENKGTRIYVKGDKNSSYGDVISLISLINSNGFNKVSLITSPVSSNNVSNNAKGEKKSENK